MTYDICVVISQWARSKHRNLIARTDVNNCKHSTSLGYRIQNHSVRIIFHVANPSCCGCCIEKLLFYHNNGLLGNVCFFCRLLLFCGLCLTISFWPNFDSYVAINVTQMGFYAWFCICSNNYNKKSQCKLQNCLNDIFSANNCRL